MKIIYSRSPEHLKKKQEYLEKYPGIDKCVCSFRVDPKDLHGRARQHNTVYESVHRQYESKTEPKKTLEQFNRQVAEYEGSEDPEELHERDEFGYFMSNYRDDPSSMFRKIYERYKGYERIKSAEMPPERGSKKQKTGPTRYGEKNYKKNKKSKKKKKSIKKRKHSKKKKYSKRR